ncbi:MAG: SDR family NAD(P)-dependent oxidoreductase [Alphaproteobacteria bacterium]|nr:SDR family NAD(P)-dependent oxidoreductase [Alphaproteobacteria bacterium]
MISGANRGIGKAIAERLRDAGYLLSLGVRRSAEIERLGAAFDPGRTMFFPYEARDKQSPVDWVAATVERFGKLDAIVNAAGILHNFSFLEDAEDRFDELIDINVKGPMRLMREAYPHLKKSGAGRIVNLASLSGLRVPSQSAGYAMSKFAVVALTHSARHVGWHDGVRATAICPGFVNTDMVAEYDVVPSEEMIQPEDVATIVQTVIEMPNTTSISHIPLNCTVESGY